MASVVPAFGAGEDLVPQILARCRERLADFKVPREVFVVDELPRSTLEKVAKNKLRDRARELLGTGETKIDTPS